MPPGRAMRRPSTIWAGSTSTAKGFRQTLSRPGGCTQARRCARAPGGARGARFVELTLICCQETGLRGHRSRARGARLQRSRAQPTPMVPEFDRPPGRKEVQLRLRAPGPSLAFLASHASSRRRPRGVPKDSGARNSAGQKRILTPASSASEADVERVPAISMSCAPMCRYPP